MFKKKALLALTVFSLSVGVVQAETIGGADPGATLKRSREEMEYRRLEKELQGKKGEQAKDSVVDQTGKVEEKVPQGDAVIAVSHIETDSSKILTEAEIRAITVKYEGRDVSIKELFQAVKEINELYGKKSYITARAFLPPQKVEGGIVRIKLVEGRLGAFALEGNKHTNSSYILDRISLHSGDLFKLDRLQNDILYFNKTNDVQLKAELKPGKEFGTTDCVLRLEEPNNWQVTMFTDNAGRIDTGLYRAGMTIVNNSLFGRRDPLVLTPIWSQGTLAGSASYNIPINSYGTRLGVSYDKNETSILSGPFESLDIKGHSSDFGVNLSHPFQAKSNYKLDGVLEVHHKNSETDYSGANLSNTTVNTVGLGFTAQLLDDTGIWYLRNNFTDGSSDARGQFFRYNLYAARQQVVCKDRFMIYRLAGQLIGNSHLLPSTEQFTLGGASTVRGYPEGYLSGDEGYYISAEYNFPLASSKKVRCFVFADHGGVFPYKGAGVGTNHRDYLYSTGFGATMNFSKTASGKLTFGFPIDPPRGQSKVRIHFFMETGLL